MKITFPLPDDNQLHEYCVHCSSENVEKFKEGDGRTMFRCTACGKESSRRISIDPKLVWRVDEETKELVHESVGIFLSNQDEKVLFFELTKFPFGFAIPAGHLDTSETPLEAIKRELAEETTLAATDIELVSEEKLEGDCCSRGADIHLWHLYKGRVSGDASAHIDDHEGGKPVWLTLAEAQDKELTFPPRYFIEKYGEKLLSL
jgi:8-oxo-dGTP pyrophosphatase MutT (NUDIX family)